MQRQPAVLLVLILALVPLPGCGGRSGPGVVLTERVRPPFIVEERRALLGQPLGRFSCPPPTAPVRDLTPESFYGDRDGSIVNPAALARYREAVRPLTVFEAQVTAIGDAFVRSRPAERAAAACTLEWLDAWAAQDALLGRVSRQGLQDRASALVAIAASYLKVMDVQRSPRAEAWVRRLSAAVLASHASPSGGGAKDHQAYWAGAAVGLAGAVLNEKPLYAWGVGQLRQGILQIAQDGTLPLELARKSKARHYHDLALIALVQLAELAAQNGTDLYRDPDGGLRRLGNRVIESLDDPGVFERLTGARQEWMGELSGGDLVWMEPYFARVGDRRLVPWLTRFRPLRLPAFGGDATLLYGVKDL
jgi:poly(beta-D-mannuronate) lyase